MHASPWPLRRLEYLRDWHAHETIAAERSAGQLPPGALSPAEIRLLFERPSSIVPLVVRNGDPPRPCHQGAVKRRGDREKPWRCGACRVGSVWPWAGSRCTMCAARVVSVEVANGATDQC